MIASLNLNWFRKISCANLIVHLGGKWLEFLTRLWLGSESFGKFWIVDNGPAMKLIRVLGVSSRESSHIDLVTFFHKRIKQNLFLDLRILQQSAGLRSYHSWICKCGYLVWESLIGCFHCVPQKLDIRLVHQDAS